MPDLTFEIVNAELKPFAAIPTIDFYLRISNSIQEEEVYAAAIKCQVIIEPNKRIYDTETKEKLYELFGEPVRWEETMNSVQWIIVNIPVPRFTGSTNIKVSIACTEEQTLAAGKYFHAVRDGKIPLAFLFSGTLFYKAPDDKLLITQVPWEKEAQYKMPASIWEEMMEAHFPDGRWLRIRKDVYDRLIKYKARSTFLTLEDCVEAILDQTLKEINITEKENA
ncbi:MAG: DUF6084 family protein [bacterium]